MRCFGTAVFALVLWSVSAAPGVAQDTANFLYNYNATKCLGEGGTWHGMSCNNTSVDEAAIVERHRVNSKDGLVVDVSGGLAGAEAGLEGLEGLSELLDAEGDQ